ncbi:MAG TPA: tripartite tricarboxylate transporter substrate binding protein [Burkholderiales bacterium]|jgi:tripartite-type tricarboxylate transporter receptor subunit TctC|nr:tripartite tricarboxylate transporter substrate binding protein [Burkholderiales bacterium]
MKKVLLLAVLAFAAGAQAQTWPSKAVRFIVPFPPGGSTDVAARTVADKLTHALGAQVLVENRAGGGGAIGTVEAARAAPDGHTLLFAADPVITLHLVVKNMQFDMQRDFIAVTQVTTQPIAVAVHSSLPVKDVQELIAYAKANPGKLSFAHSGTGSGQHMSGELLKKMAGIDMVHVPYKGGGPAVQDLVGGQVPVGVLGSTPLIPHHKAGRIRIIAFTSKERFPPMPEIPTLHESGLAGFDTTQWLGILAPKGTPADIVDRVYAETRKALELQDVKERLAQAALQPVGNSPKEFEALIRADLERWSAVAKELKLEPQ